MVSFCLLFPPGVSKLAAAAAAGLADLSRVRDGLVIVRRFSGPFVNSPLGLIMVVALAICEADDDAGTNPAPVAAAAVDLFLDLLASLKLSCE